MYALLGRNSTGHFEGGGGGIFLIGEYPINQVGYYVWTTGITWEIFKGIYLGLYLGEYIRFIVCWRIYQGYCLNISGGISQNNCLNYLIVKKSHQTFTFSLTYTYLAEFCISLIKFWHSIAPIFFNFFRKFLSQWIATKFVIFQIILHPNELSGVVL